MLVPVIITYKAISTDTPANISTGDIITYTQFWEITSSTAATGSVLWHNATKLALTTAVPNISNLAIAAGSGGGGSGFADLLLTDDNSVLFIGKDTGATTPSIVYYRIDTLAVYTPVGTIRVAGSAPTGLATSALQTTGNTSLSAINTTLGTPLQAGGHVIVDSVPTTNVAQSGTWTVQPGNTANTVAWKVDGSAVTQPISASSLPLPSLAATSTKQSDGSQKTQLVDGSGNVIASTSNALNVNLSSGGFATASGQTTQATSLATIATNTTGASTSANQTTVISNQTNVQANAGSDATKVLAIQGVTNGKMVGIKEMPFSVTANFTRPANTTQYVVGYAMSNATSSPTQLTLTPAAANQSGTIEQVTVVSSVKGSPLAQLMAWVSGSTLASATFSDGAALEIDSTTFAKDVAAIPLVETANTAAKARMSASNLKIPFTADSSGNLYMILSLLNTYTPASGEVLTVVIKGTLR